MKHRCPACRETLARPALEGGLLLTGRQFVIHPDRLTYRCAKCGHEETIRLKVQSREQARPVKVVLKTKPA